MKIKNRGEVLSDLIKDAKKYPNDWKAVLGHDNINHSRDYYILNTNVGVYFLKEFEKNPYEFKGIGGKIARRVDEDVFEKITKKEDNFGIIQGDIKRITTSIRRGIRPDQIFEAALDQSNKNYGITIPMKGKASTNGETFQEMRTNLVSNQKKIDTKFEKMATGEGLYRSYE